MGIKGWPGAPYCSSSGVDGPLSSALISRSWVCSPAFEAMSQQCKQTCKVPPPCVTKCPPKSSCCSSKPCCSPAPVVKCPPKTAQYCPPQVVVQCPPKCKQPPKGCC